MASKQSTVDYILEQVAEAGGVSARKMFGEYALYQADKLVGLICDDQLFIKPTPGGRALLGGGVTEAAPYPSAKPCFLIPGEDWDDAARLTALVKVTAAELPPPKKKTSEARKAWSEDAASIARSSAEARCGPKSRRPSAPACRIHRGSGLKCGSGVRHR